MIKDKLFDFFKKYGFAIFIGMYSGDMLKLSLPGDFLLFILIFGIYVTLIDVRSEHENKNIRLLTRYSYIIYHIIVSLLCSVNLFSIGFIIYTIIIIAAVELKPLKVFNKKDIF